jgi:hypothetical protein
MTKKPKSKKTKSTSQASRPVVNKKSSAGTSSFFLKEEWGLYALLGISALCFLIARFKLLAIPLERDEGSFAYISHWLWRGKELYTDMLDSKLPGLYAYYSVFITLFGYNATGVHTGLLFANIASGICFYFLLKEVYSRYMAMIGTSLLLWMMVSINVMGYAAHATQLLMPFMLAGMLFFWNGLQKNKLHWFFLSGLLIGISFTIKQQSAVFGILIALIWWPARLWWNKHEKYRVPIAEWILLGVGGLLPAAAVFLYFLQSGRFDLFYDWTVTQPINLAKSFTQPWYEMFSYVFPMVTEGFWGVWISAGLGLVLIFISGFKKFGSTFGFAFGLIGLASVIIGAAYYQHYFAVVLPGLALLSACTINWISQKTGKAGPWLGIGIVVFLLSLALAGRSDYYFKPDYAKIHYKIYGHNMFPEIEKIGEELKKRVPEGASIGVMGSEPEVLVVADRAGCSKYLMVYAMLFDPVRSPPMQQEYIKEMQDCAPDYIVWNTMTGSWTTGYDGLQFFDQLMDWVELNYDHVGLAESRDDKPGIVIWDQELVNHQPQSDFKVYVFRKKQTPTAPQG